MDYFINYAPGFIGIYFICFSFLVNTKNKMSALLFQIIPFFSGAALMFITGKLLHLI